MFKKSRIKKIIIDTSDRFVGYYKNHRISINNLHGGEKHSFDIEVEAPDGTYAVNTWERFDNIDSAIDFAVRGAMIYN